MEGDGEVVNLDVPGHWVDAEDPRAGPGVRGQTGLLVQAPTELLWKGEDK